MKCKRCIREVSRLFQGSIKKVSRKFQECFEEVSRVFQESFYGASRKFKAVSMEYYVDFKGSKGVQGL